MNLCSERLNLKPLSLEELNGDYIFWLNDNEVCKYNSHGETIYTKEMAKDFINSLKNDKSKKVYAVYLKENNFHIGNISLQQINLKNNNAEIAFLFGDKNNWNKGFAKEAAKLLIDYAFNELKLHRLYFGTHSENIAMQKLGEKLGFCKEGIQKHAQYKNNEYNDIVIYGLIKQRKDN